MATPRKRYFRVADSILFENWDDNQLATMVRLCAYLNVRWAREGRHADEACEADLCIADLFKITRKNRVDVARKSLQRLADVTSMSAERCGDVTRVRWRKFVEYQEFASLSASASAASPASATQKKEPKTMEAPSAPPAPRARVRRSAGAVDPRVQAAWPAIRAAFAEHGTQLGESIGLDRSLLIAKRLDEGASPDDLVRAVHGYVRLHGLERRGDFDPARYFRPQTVFKAEGFSDRVDAGTGPRPAGSGTVSKTERMWGHIR